MSDLDWVSATNGYGPVEQDMSNGGRDAGDGRTITLDGKTYTKGLGVHAVSEISYYLGGNCSTLTADVGVDDEVQDDKVGGDTASVVFRVFADGQKVYDSNVVRLATPTKPVNLSVASTEEIELVVTDAKDGKAAEPRRLGRRPGCLQWR